jgi:3-deoxy-7-phosphoheptulonate synthase
MQRSWLNLEAIQQPNYASESDLSQVLSTLSEVPALISIKELQLLKDQIHSSALGTSLILQIGDCAEAFSDSTAKILETKLKAYSEYASILHHATNKPTLTIGRIAGQFTKPRSEPYEVINDCKIKIGKVLSYKGDLVNSINPSLRDPDPQRLLQGYYNSAVITNFIRLQDTWIYTSHEALHMKYENALTREYNDKYVNVGSHLLWIGERTRKYESAHVEYLSQIINPIGIKLGPNADLEELLKIIAKLNPSNENGKIVLITRLGAKKYRQELPRIVDAVKASGYKLAWIVDPMHGNTYKCGSGIKTRNYEDILDETLGTIEILKSSGEVPAGLHLEASYTDVTEVIGLGVAEEDLNTNYCTLCDPRLNYTQTISLLNQAALLLV